MLLSQLFNLEETTKDEIRKAQLLRDSRAISDGAYEELYESIMTKYRLKTNEILSSKRTQDYYKSV